MRAFRIAYDGREYYGFQRQPDVPTVENAIFDALEQLTVEIPAGGKPTGYAAAGRTDAGVSAVAQTIAFEAPKWLTPRALNVELPVDIRAWASAETPPDFHATHHATEREYTYHCYWPARDSHGGDEDDERVFSALTALSGEHDWHNLTPDDRNTVRELTCEATRDGDFLVITVTSGGFSRELVRRLVSLVHAVGSGAKPFETIDRVLSPDPLPGHEGIAPAPPEPLVLTDVGYPALEFTVDEQAAASARSVFKSRRIDRLTGARVAERVRDGIHPDDTGSR